MVRHGGGKARGFWWVDFENVALRPNATAALPRDAEMHVAVGVQDCYRLRANGLVRGLHAVVRAERVFSDVGFQAGDAAGWRT
jgi:hypothetical protein